MLQVFEGKENTKQLFFIFFFFHASVFASLDFINVFERDAVAVFCFCFACYYLFYFRSECQRESNQTHSY